LKSSGILQKALIRPQHPPFCTATVLTGTPDYLCGVRQCRYTVCKVKNYLGPHSKGRIGGITFLPTFVSQFIFYGSLQTIAKA